MTMDRSNTTAICNKVFDMALNGSGLPWAASRQWRMPLAETIVDYPYLVVTAPRTIGYWWQGNITPSMPRTMSMAVEVNNVDIYAIYPNDSEDPLTFSTPQDALDTLKHLFATPENLSLGGVVNWTRIENPLAGDLWISRGEGIQVINPKRFYAAGLTVQTYVELRVVP